MSPRFYVAMLVLCFSLSARADKLYAISTLSGDEFVTSALQSFPLAMQKFRESAAASVQGGQLVLEFPHSFKCPADREVFTPSHVASGGKLIDALEVTSCGVQWGAFVLEREGANLKPMTDDELFDLAFPSPKDAASYHLKSSTIALEIMVENRGPGERDAGIAFSFGPYDMDFRIADVSATSGTRTLSGRGYTIDVHYRAQHSYVVCEERRIQIPGQFDSFDYFVGSSKGARKEQNSGEFLATYQSDIEGNAISIISSFVPDLLKYGPGSITFN